MTVSNMKEGIIRRLVNTAARKERVLDIRTAKKNYPNSSH